MGGTVWLPANRVGHFFAALRDIAAFWVAHLGKGTTSSQGEVDLDATKSHVDRSSVPGKAIHKGRLFIFKERGSAKRKIVAMPDLTVPKHAALPPESNKDISRHVKDSLRAGSITGGDGGRAIAPCVAKAALGKVPLATAVHSKKQYTAFSKIKKDAACGELKQVLIA